MKKMLLFFSAFLFTLSIANAQCNYTYCSVSGSKATVVLNDISANKNNNTVIIRMSTDGNEFVHFRLQVTVRIEGEDTHGKYSTTRDITFNETMYKPEDIFTKSIPTSDFTKVSKIFIEKCEFLEGTKCK